MTEIKWTKGRIRHTQAPNGLFRPEDRIETYDRTEIVECGKDAKGRMVGKHATVLARPVGYAVSIYTARNGRKFGAIPRHTVAPTLADGIELAVKRLTAAVRRAQKESK